MFILRVHHNSWIIKTWKHKYLKQYKHKWMFDTNDRITNVANVQTQLLMWLIIILDCSNHHLWFAQNSREKKYLNEYSFYNFIVFSALRWQWQWAPILYYRFYRKLFLFRKFLPHIAIRFQYLKSISSVEKLIKSAGYSYLESMANDHLSRIPHNTQNNTGWDPTVGKKEINRVLKIRNISRKN